MRELNPIYCGDMKRTCARLQGAVADVRSAARTVVTAVLRWWTAACPPPGSNPRTARCRTIAPRAPRGPASVHCN